MDGLELEKVVRFAMVGVRGVFSLVGIDMRTIEPLMGILVYEHTLIVASLIGVPMYAISVIKFDVTPVWKFMLRTTVVTLVVTLVDPVRVAVS